MKKLLFIALLTVIFSCKKDKNTDQLTGKWEYRGHVYNTGIDKQPAGNGNLISFNNGTYKRTSNGQVTQSGSYIITQEMLRNENVSRIIYDNDGSPPKVFFKIENSKLTFYGEIPTVSDGAEEYYERL